MLQWKHLDIALRMYLGSFDQDWNFIITGDWFPYSIYKSYPVLDQTLCVVVKAP